MRLLNANHSLVAGVLAAIGGAWISNLVALESYRPYFIGLTLVFLGLSFRKLYLVRHACAPDMACPPAVLRRQRLIFWLVTITILCLLALPWAASLLI